MKLFFLFLIAAAWQDLRTKHIGIEVLLAGAAAGLWSCIMNERFLGEILLAMLPGIGLLLLSVWTQGLLGEGDGWFFVVSGTFLGWKEIIFLLVFGQLFCGIFGLAVTMGALFGTGAKIRRMRLPFLPFLLPAALWMAIMRIL